MIDKWDYRREVCPYCRSPRLERVALLTPWQTRSADQRFRDNIRQEPIPIKHRQCQNCRRVFHENKIKIMFDRAAMRRDFKKLGVLLGLFKK